jgi:glycerophosphoryl diester phosphodiesterase
MTLCIAHRGDPSTHRENTLPSFQSAVAKGADVIELDISRSSDGHVVLLHDDTLERLWKVNARIEDLTLAEIRERTQGFYEIPLFDDVLDYIQVPIMADLKSVAPVGPLVDLLDKRDAWNRVFIMGELEAVRLVRRVQPKARIGLTWTDMYHPSEELLRELEPEYLCLMWRFLQPAFIQACAQAERDEHHTLNETLNRLWPIRAEQPEKRHRFASDHLFHGARSVHAFANRGIDLCVWTVDEVYDMSAMVRCGVHGIISNRIDRLVSLVKSACPQLPNGTSV